jgi:hypothetical protein
MTNALAIYKDFDGLQRAAMALQKSNYFQDVKSEAQAIVKVMAGSELGLPPFASMSGIHIIQGKPVLGANVIATLVKNDPRYDYRIKQADNQACILTWYENGERVGEAGFTIQEANGAGLTGKDNWKKYTSDMLFARAISRGARRFAPGIFGGSPVYTPDEMGVDTDEDGYIDGTSVTVSEPEYKAQVPAGEATVKAVRDNLPDAFTEDIDQAIADAGPANLMTLDEAVNVTNSDGEFYGQLTNEKLAAMTIGINRGLKKPDLTDEQRETYHIKLNAIKTILQARENGEI